MGTLLTSSLSQSFRTVPPAAVPAMLDCISTSTGVLPSSLFDSLLPDFSNLIKVILDDNKKLGSKDCAFLVSYLRGLSHLMKKMGVNSVPLECFMWDGFIPLMKLVLLYEKEMLHEIVESVLEVVIETNSWELIEATLVPVLLGSVGFSMDMYQNKDNSVIKWSRHSFQNSRELQKSVSICDKAPLLPLTLSCYVLSCLLDAAAENYQAVKRSSISVNVISETFCGHLLWDLCNLTIQLLSQSLDHRSCTTSLLLPSIFKAFSLKCSFEVCIQGESFCISRQHFFMNLWKCSQVLFALGLSERRDAYCIISLYLSYFSSVDRSQVEMDDRAEEIDIRAEKEFWDEIKRGLVEKEGLIRKQSLYILKRVMLINDEGQLNPVVTEKKSCHRGPVPQGMTKRDLWAEEEAKSLGVGQICLSDDKYLSEKKSGRHSYFSMRCLMSMAPTWLKLHGIIRLCCYFNLVFAMKVLWTLKHPSSKLMRLVATLTG